MSAAAIIPKKITECAIGVAAPDAVCTPADMVELIATKLDMEGKKTPQEVIEQAKQSTGCDTEKCAVTRLGALKEDRFKPIGPTDTRLISNRNIEDIFAQYERNWPEFFGYNFNMINYAQYSFRAGRVIAAPDTLATIDFADLMAAGKRTAGCIINSDVYQGPGKHWMALFVDWREATTAPIAKRAEGRASIEFFNSSGRAPDIEWINWMQKTKTQMATENISAEIVRVTSVRHQQSRSECGIYSLFYIYARLKGVPYTAFDGSDGTLHDKYMIEFRQHLFAPADGHPNATQFDFDDFQRRHKIQWANNAAETESR